MDSIFSSSPRPDWPWTIRLTEHFVVTQHTYRFELVLQCSSNQCCIGPHICWKVMMWASFDVELQKGGSLASPPCWCHAQASVNPECSPANMWAMNPFLCILFLVLRFAGKVDHEVGSTANLDFMCRGRRRRTGCVSTSFFIHSTSSLKVLSSTFPRIAVCSNSSISSRVFDLNIWGQPPTWIGKMPRCGCRRQTPSLFHSILQPSFSMSKPIGKIGSTSAHPETITPPGVIRSWVWCSQSCSWHMILLDVVDGVHGWPQSPWGLVFFQKKLGSTWTPSTSESSAVAEVGLQPHLSLGSFATLVVEGEAVDAEVVRLFNILYCRLFQKVFHWRLFWASLILLCLWARWWRFLPLNLLKSWLLWRGVIRILWSCACRRHMVWAAAIPESSLFIFDIVGKVACLSPFATLVCKEKWHFGFSSFPSLFVGDLPVSSSPFFAFVLSASKDFNFGCSPLAAAVDAPGFFSVKATCSNSARRWQAKCSTLLSFGVVSPPSPDGTRDTLNCSSLWLSSCFFDIFKSPLSCRAGSGGTAPISFARFLHRSQHRSPPGASLRLWISGGSSKLLRMLCFSETPPGL